MSQPKPSRCSQFVSIPGALRGTRQCKGAAIEDGKCRHHTPSAERAGDAAMYAQADARRRAERLEAAAPALLEFVEKAVELLQAINIDDGTRCTASALLEREARALLAEVKKP